MSATATKPIIFVALGIFVGFLLGLVVTMAWQSEDTSESYADYRERMQPGSHGEKPPVRAPQTGAGHGGDRAEQSFAKVHFMKKFVKALTQEPDNMGPNPAYEPLLKDPAEPLVCADCHDPKVLNLEAMLTQDPGHESVEPYRRSPRFMIPLMQNWVKRLNDRHAGRLRKEITCTDCHAFDPRNMAERVRIYPPLMVSFVKALKERPTNRNPARGWTPLLKAPDAANMLCAVCHGKTGQGLELAVKDGRLDLTRPDDFADNKRFMAHLMESWVERLNLRAKPLLVKTVVCLDCHDSDPRR
ncbi:MAG: hypothetical protein ACYTEZ_07745 [Planctomycetota bacterium]|jgi:hypothetical protein